LVGLPVDLLVTHGTPGTLAAKRATTTIPIVMAIRGDAATELVASLARPGGNITGSTFFFPELIAKRLELLKEALPRASRLAALANADNTSDTPALRALDSRARALKVDFQPVEIRGAGEFRDAFATMVRPAGRRGRGRRRCDDPGPCSRARKLGREESAAIHRHA
jgi:putative ABC transport system substrate-binding protein